MSDAVFKQEVPSLKTPQLVIVVPCFNEQDALPETAKQLAANKAYKALEE